MKAQGLLLQKVIHDLSMEASFFLPQTYCLSTTKKGPFLTGRNVIIISIVFSPQRYDTITFKTYQVLRGVFSTFIDENDTFETVKPLLCAYNEITKKYKSRQTILDFFADRNTSRQSQVHLTFFIAILKLSCFSPALRWKSPF